MTSPRCPRGHLQGSLPVEGSPALASAEFACCRLTKQLHGRPCGHAAHHHTCTAIARIAASRFEERRASGRASSDSTKPHLSVCLCDGSTTRAELPGNASAASKSCQTAKPVSRRSGSEDCRSLTTAQEQHCSDADEHGHRAVKPRASRPWFGTRSESLESDGAYCPV